MRLIQTSHLKTWAASKAAESQFPQLIRDLIYAVIQPEKLSMPSGDAIWTPGFDGIVENKEKNMFVPTGLSVWELGTNTNYRKKANDDYNKRIKDKTIDHKNTTFVFVTPLVWKDHETWIAERKADGIWKDVEVIDGNKLQNWLESAPLVSLQFAAKLGIVPESGLQTPDVAWEEWQQLTEPPLSEELVVVGREEQEKELIARLNEPPNTIIVQGDSSREAWGFTLAALRQVTPEEKRLNLHARTIIVEDETVASRLHNFNNLIVVLKQASGQVSRFLSSRGCHVVVPVGNDSHLRQNPIVLKRSTHRPFAEALVKMGLSENKAEYVTRACGCSITILMRQLAHTNYVPPQWVKEQSVVNLMPALLASRWDDRNEADREILCHLANTSRYEDVQKQLNQFLSVEEPPLQKIGDMWMLTAPVDTFQLVGRRLTGADLMRFKDAFREVFGKIDPKVEIPPDQWIHHDIKENTGHSDWLRCGMAETLLLISERGTDAKLECVPSPRRYAEEIVRGLPGLNDDWRVLASLRDQCARLMESAPDPFLDSLEHLLEAKPGEVRKLFADGKGIFGGGAMHTGLLWGLEILAWDPDYLSRVALILAKLARLDPGGQIANRPINSLREIFLWWHPGTNASTDHRLAAIDLILDREPDVGWTLLEKLLPNERGSIAYPTAKPRWRDLGDLPEESRTPLGQLHYLSAIVDRALERAGSDPQRWGKILDSLRMLGPAQQKRALDLLDSITRSSISADVQTALWETLRDFTYRTIQNADWALAKEFLNRLEEILARLTPDNPIERNRWLFEEWLPVLPSREEDIEKCEEQVEELRQRAVREILQEQGVKGLVKLGTTCKFPGFVAAAAVPLINDLGAVSDFIKKAIAVGKEGFTLVSQISSQALRLFGEAWPELICKEAKTEGWSPGTTASLLLEWPNGRTTWEVVETLGADVDAEYWRRKPIFLIDGTPEEVAYQIDRLIEVGRSAEAFSCVAHRGRGVPTEVLVRLFDASFDELARVRTVEEIRRFRMNSHDVCEFLDELRKRSDLPREELARIEYRALPILGFLHSRRLTLHEFMAEDPNFFVEILCDAFLPAHRDKSQDVKPTPEEQAKAKAAFTLLQGMDRLPGQSEGNQIDEEVLLRWIDIVRNMAVEVDRAVIADEKIGHLLAHAPEDPEDSSWPHRAVRNVIEKLASEDIDRGLMIERFNMRGTFCRAVDEGGDQERALANQYHGWAKISRTRWPRTARVLKAIAENWEEWARREDLEAEQRKLD